MNPNKFCPAGKCECEHYHIIMGFKTRLPTCNVLHWQVADFERCPIPSKIEAVKAENDDMDLPRKDWFLKH